MGKLLTTLRTNTPATQRPQPEVAPEDFPPEPVGGDVPFIEIGPRRSVLASPDVIAPAGPTKPPAAVPAPPAPTKKGVGFRSLLERKQARISQDVVAFHEPDSPEARQYAKLLTSLIDAGRKRPGACQVLLFTGSRTEAGCTTALLNVAVAAARKRFEVAVLDANLRRPAVAARLALDDAPGMAEVLGDEVPASEALRETDQEKLSALTAGAPGPVLADLAAISSLVSQMRETFDLVLIDGPRWDGRAVCAALAQEADAVFLVAPTGEADGPPAADLMRELPAQGVRLAGCVLTDV